MHPGRPRRPGYESVNRVLDAIRMCSCGKHRGKPGVARKLSLKKFLRRYKCTCVGPKTPTELLKITRLDRNALFNTLRFLTEKKVLIRTRLKKHGYHVQYSISKTYGSQYLEIELSSKERKQYWKMLFESARPVTPLIEYIRKFEQTYHKAVEMLIATPAGRSFKRKGPFWEYMYLVKLIATHGLKEGVSQFFREYDKINPLREPIRIDLETGKTLNPEVNFKPYALWKVFGSAKQLRQLRKS